MGLETGTFIDDLVATNPIGASDPKSQGDDHLRLIKSVTKSTFPNASRAFRFPVAAAAKTGAYTVVAADANAFIRGDANSAAFTVTLPLLSSVFAGFIVTIMKSDSSNNAVTVDGNGAETINGATTRTLAAQYDVEVYESEGSEWKVIASITDDREASAVASATTTEIWATDGKTLHITGTATITSLGTAPRAGAWRKVIFDGALTLTHGANLNLPGSANITTAAGDFAFVYADTTTQLDVLYFKKDGTAVSATVIAQATRSAIEAETNQNTYVPPDLLKHNPGMAKVLCKWEQTGAHSILSSHNMTSVTDGGAVGNTDHLWNVNFSSNEYVLVPGPSDNRILGGTPGTFVAGGVTTQTRVPAGTGIDENINTIAIYGDQ